MSTNQDDHNPDVDPPEQPFDGFTMTCDQCNGRNVFIENTLRAHGGGEQTGTWYTGDVRLICRHCGYSFELRSHWA